MVRHTHGFPRIQIDNLNMEGEKLDSGQFSTHVRTAGVGNRSMMMMGGDDDDWQRAEDVSQEVEQAARMSDGRYAHPR